ncbi:unnamed protein product [Parajaminaea phylloscopi]
MPGIVANGAGHDASVSSSAAAAAAPSSSSLPPQANGNGNGRGQHARVSKNAKRRAKKKQEKAAEVAVAEGEAVPATAIAGAPEHEDVKPAVASTSKITSDDTWVAPEQSEVFGLFKDVFQKFQAPPEGAVGADGAASGPAKGDVIYSDDEAMSDSEASDRGEDGSGQPLSRRRQKKLSRLTIAELKQMVKRPEVVEWSDVTAADPKLLVQMKSTRNTVPVPPHWSQKRDYLQNKRGIEKAPFELPAYIAETGIGTVKDALKEKEADQSLKAKTRERVQPKMGKVVVDYQKLHDAFFRFQTKPPLSQYGETYYEGKEYETKFKERKPGDLSAELKEALSIPPMAPPPWLIAMQRFGPPPSYPHLKVPGLSAPIPEGAQWGFHPGGWGRPPLDEFGNPLYGDVLGLQQQQQEQQQQQQQHQETQRSAGWVQEEALSHEPWGALDPEESDDEEEDESEEEDEGDGDQSGGEDQDGDEYQDNQRLPAGGLETPGGIQSVSSRIPGGLETPDFLELRKQRSGGIATPADDMVDARPQQHRSLYQVLPETQTRVQGFMGSERGYDFGGPGASSAGSGGAVLGAEDDGSRKRKLGGAGGSAGVEVALDPSQLENLSESELAERYEAAKREQQNHAHSGTSGAGGSEDLALLREELARKRRITEEKRRERAGGGGGGGGGAGGGKFKF